jgi:hypothetical protein
MASQRVVLQYDWAAVKENPTHGDKYVSYDIWTWNVYKMKWTRMSNHGCGFGSAADADLAAKSISDETARMLAQNQSPPAGLK